MNIFKSEKAPYVFGLLLSVIGWHVSQFANQITETQAVSYTLDVNRETGDIVAQVRNVSRTRSLVNAKFSIACAHGDPCLTSVYPAGDPVYGVVQPVPPNAVGGNDSVGTPMSVWVVNTVAAGGVYNIRAKLANPQSQVDFYYLPDPARPLDIFIYRRRTLTGFLVENYLFLLVISLGICILALAASFLLNMKSGDSGQQEVANGDGVVDAGAARADASRRGSPKRRDKRTNPAS